MNEVYEKVLEKYKRIEKIPTEYINSQEFIHYSVFNFGAVECLNWKYTDLPNVWKLDKKICIYYIKRNLINMKDLPISWNNKNDQLDVVLACLEKDPRNVAFLTEEFKDSKEIFRKILPHNGELIKFASFKLQDDEEIALIALRTKNNPYETKRLTSPFIYAPLNYLSYRLKCKLALIKESLNYSLDNFFYIPDHIRFNKNFLIEIAEVHPYIIDFIEPKYLDKDIVFTAVNTNGQCLYNLISFLNIFGLPRFTMVKKEYDISNVHTDLYSQYLNDENIARVGCVTFGSLYEIIGSELKKIRDIAYSAVKQNGMIAEYLYKEFLDDVDFALAAVKENPDSLKYFPKFQNNVRVLMMASKMNNLFQIQHYDVYFQFIEEIFD